MIFEVLKIKLVYLLWYIQCYSSQSLGIAKALESEGARYLALFCVLFHRGCLAPMEGIMASDCSFFVIQYVNLVKLLSLSPCSLTLVIGHSPFMLLWGSNSACVCADACSHMHVSVDALALGKCFWNGGHCCHVLSLSFMWHFNSGEQCLENRSVVGTDNPVFEVHVIVTGLSLHMSENVAVGNKCHLSESPIIILWLPKIRLYFFFSWKEITHAMLLTFRNHSHRRKITLHTWFPCIGSLLPCVWVESARMQSLRSRL